MAPTPLPTMKPFVPLTAIVTEADPPTVTGKVTPFVAARLKLSVVAVTVRLTVVVTAAPPPVPVTVIACAPEGNAMLGAVVMVRVTVVGRAPG